MNTIKTEDKIEIKLGYKKTPVGIMPENWEVISFKDVVIRKSERFDPLENPNTKDLELDSFEQKTGRIINVYNSEDFKSSKSIFNKGDVLFGKLRPYLKKYWLAEFDGVCSTEVWVFKNSKKITSEYLYFIIQTKYFLRFADMTSGTKMPRSEWSVVKNAKLPIPPLPEQKAIADCLSTWDKGIEKLSALIASKKEQKKGLMQQLLTGKKRLDGFTEEWKEVRLGKYFKERNQRGFNDLDLLSIGEEGVYPQSDSNKKDTSNSDKSKYKLIEIGDLGYNTMRLWQGRIALSNIRGIVSPAYTILIPQTGKVNSNYYSYLFKMPFVVNKFYRNSQGMVSDTLTCRYNDFKKIKLFIPSIEEQAAIAEVLITADKEIELLEKKLESFKTQKKGLMQVLLTGERRLI